MLVHGNGICQGDFFWPGSFVTVGSGMTAKPSTCSTANYFLLMTGKGQNQSQISSTSSTGSTGTQGALVFTNKECYSEISAEN